MGLEDQVCYVGPKGKCFQTADFQIILSVVCDEMKVRPLDGDSDRLRSGCVSSRTLKRYNFERTHFLVQPAGLGGTVP